MAEYSELVRRARQELNAPTTDAPVEGDGMTATTAPDTAALAAEEAMAQAEAHQRRTLSRVKAEGEADVDVAQSRAKKRVASGWSQLETPDF